MKILNKKGVTLIEIMVAVAIISILISISYPSWNYIIKKARTSEAKVNLALVASAQHRYKAHCNTFHPDFGLIGAIPSGTIHYDVQVLHDNNKANNSSEFDSDSANAGQGEGWKTCGNKVKTVCSSGCKQGFHGATGVCYGLMSPPCTTRNTEHYMFPGNSFNSRVVGPHFSKCYGSWASADVTITENDFCLFAASALKGIDNPSGYSIWMMNDNEVLEEIQ